MSQATLGGAPYRNSDLFSGYYLDERIDDLDGWDCNDEAREAFEELQQLWELEGELVASYKEDELLDSWIDEVLGVLGFSTLSETTLPDSEGYNDRLLFDSGETRRDASIRKRDGDTEAMYGLASAVLEAKQWDVDFTKRFAETRSYRDASHQIKYYLEHTPERLQWGVLTDGKKWRLYGTKDYATETYYEIDLPELLESGDLDAFKYFFCFFRPDAFREVSGTSFLETVWNESETAAQELGEDLQDNVFTALRILGEGFIETNDLDIDPDDEAARDELKEQSLVLLYRLMFVLYAESRHLISPDDPSRAVEFNENFSLDELRQDIHEDISSGDSFDDYSEYSTSMWGQLEDLFRLIDAGEESLGIPPYNGGLFDSDTHQFLANNEVADRYIAEVVYRLGTTRAEDGSGYVLADYADLDTRHLGTIYEGLLEHEFRIAPEQYAAVSEDSGQVWKPATEVSVADAVETVDRGELYVVNDEGERKATGAYYTPDYVVAYIVEETIDPLIEEIKTDIAEEEGLEPGDKGYIAPFLEQVRDLTVLDPAMGSGHFLTKATGYLTEQVMEVIREQEIQGYDEQDIRRILARECIYGVDINGMAVELAKLSMWLETLATDQPLAFLDHHLKTGNSLVGSDITEVLSDNTAEEGGQLTLMQALARVRRDTLEHVMELMSELLAIDNETLADIKSMEETYDEIRSDPLYGRLFEMANVHTAERFGLDVPQGVYEEMAGAIEDEAEWAEVQARDWFRSAQAMADEKDFFHWELEYPEVFFGTDGEKREDGGFDAVVGNPPYAKIPAKLGDAINERITNDLYTQFIARSSSILRQEGILSFITPVSWETGPAFSSVRDLLFHDGGLQSIVNLPYNVFPDAYIDTGVFKWQKGSTSETCLISDLSGTRQSPEIAVENLEREQVPTLPWHALGFVALNSAWISLYQRIGEGKTIGDFTRSTRGVLVTDEAAESTAGDTEILLDSFQRYESVSADAVVEYKKLKEAPSDTDIFDGSRVLIRRLVSRDDRLLGTFASEFFVSKKDVYIFKSALVDDRVLLALMNSSLLSWWHFNVEMSASKDDFRQVTLGGLRDLPVPELASEPADPVIEGEIENLTRETLPDKAEWSLNSPNIRAHLIALTDQMCKLNQRFGTLNLSLVDHFGNYNDGQTLANIGFTQPPENTVESILQETTEQKPNLRVGYADVVRESETTVRIRLTARYKPDNPEAHETNPHGYTETDPLPALRITDLTKTEVDLIEAFVPVAVDEAGGFAGFRETATKTNSLVDRLRKLTLPAIDDVRDGLESYIETKERAEELEEQIERTDDLIDEIVYELYGLTEEEIEIVEEAVEE